MEISLEGLSWPIHSGTLPRRNNAHSVYSGRTALRLILQAIKENQPDTNRLIALPSYLCDSLLDPIRVEGFQPIFYGIDGALRIQVTSLQETIQTHEPAAVLFINYFGFPRNQEETNALRGIRKQTILIEDCVQGSLLESASPPVGTTGDLVFTSYRKYLPVPDGGLLINHSRLRITAPKGANPAASEITVKVLAGKLMRGLGGRDLGRERGFLDLFREAEEELATQIPMSSTSLVSSHLLSTLVSGRGLRHGMTRRRANFRHLSQAFQENARLRGIATPLFQHLPKSVSPLVFPVRVLGGLRDSIRTSLLNHGIYCPVHWKLPVLLSASNFPSSFGLSKVMLGLPIDQRYETPDMERVLQCLLNCAKSS